MVSPREFQTNYISPAKPGDFLLGTADIDFAGSRIIVASGTIAERSSNRLRAKGIGTFSQYPADRKKDVAAYGKKVG